MCIRDRIVTVLSALAVSIWLIRPTGELRIEIRPNGAIQLNGKLTQRKGLVNQLSEELRWHELWRKECGVVVAAGDSTSYKSFVELIRDVQVALHGFEDYSLTLEHIESINDETVTQPLSSWLIDETEI